MKNLPIILISIMLFNACIRSTSSLENSQDSTAYDSIKTSRYGADEYGMKRYVIALLKRGSTKGMDSTEHANLQQAHLENITRMAEEGALVLAGPFLGDGDLRGLYVFNVSSIEEAEKLTNSDPSIKAGVLIMELHEWYGSAALIDVNEIHSQLARKSVTQK